MAPSIGKLSSDPNSLIPSPSIGTMASSPQNNPPMTFHSHRCLPWEGGELKICFQSESSIGADDRPHMLVDVTLSFFVKYAVPSPVEGGYYDFTSYISPTTCYRLRVDNPSLHFSTLDASQEAIAPLLTAGSGVDVEILRLLGPDVSHLAHAMLNGADAQGHTAMNVNVEAGYILTVDLDTVEEIVNHNRTISHGMDGGEEESLGTCPVCLNEIQKEWIWPVTLACSHVFHLGCIALWLQRQNSCPLCRSEQPMFKDD